ncbi:hypothetical protein SERLA73DRAFT_188270 [Serpula lacrymans var. lacrymans S7.3]|uniref:Uncharacterized protein n=2 Tax=Serpula lacrymans var. lacrymans TaxID=341189 RepID=F8QB18_SERL3|nr:uncharacterized protein SERLADRAFT_478327 [Serpula lacrymans var. lacrymans S7.9]EGN94404.1 hypothetical protein SERLA73DRAFT_188270 [Serpula lacrymans var. lacrymans S7.3]EGO19885.1 hypothetical protein SERLADRAFT_478327 [Serpula lacrymans var. lacrymans S7.9]
MRSRSLPRAQPKTVKESRPDPPSTPAATKTTPQRPPLPHATTSQMNTEYVNMLLALDGIPRLHNMYASFFTWILLAGFVLFPGTFTTWQEKGQQQGLGSTVTELINAVQDVPLYIIAWICTGIGAAGMLWLWWRWRNNYVWIVNRIFVPGLLNSLAGIISTITSVYGGHQGEFTTTSKSTIIVTAAVALVCGVLTGWYQFWKLRLVKKQHDKEVGRELTGKHGEGVLSG